MARIVGVHGIANTFNSSANLTQEWFNALQGGVQEADAPLMRPEDLTVVAYGALFRRAADGSERTPTRSAGPSPARYKAAEQWEEELIAGWWRAAAELAAENRNSGGKDETSEDPGIQPPDFQGRARTPQLVQRGLLQLAKSRFFRPFAPTVLIAELRQVRLFLHNPDFKRAILNRLDAEVAVDTQVLIGHSLGSVVAFEGLCAHPEWRIDTFVTLGSPLGIPNVVFDALAPNPQEGSGMWPHVRRWVNISDKGDFVALVKDLAPLFGPVEDICVHNGWNSHDVTRYLVAAETGRAVADALQRGSDDSRAARG